MKSGKKGRRGGRSVGPLGVCVNRVCAFVQSKEGHTKRYEGLLLRKEGETFSCVSPGSCSIPFHHFPP